MCSLPILHTLGNFKEEFHKISMSKIQYWLEISNPKSSWILYELGTKYPIQHTWGKYRDESLRSDFKIPAKYFECNIIPYGLKNH